MKKNTPAELILNPDGTIYHLGVTAAALSSCILTVGDPERVATVTAHFDHIEMEHHKREFTIVTGSYKGKRLTVLSTGMGTDNIDIVLNELDAIFNINLENGTPKTKITPLTIIRLGTSGSIQPYIPVDTLLLSQYAVGVDALLQFYPTPKPFAFSDAVATYFKTQFDLASPYTVGGSAALLKHFQAPAVHTGVTITHPGFYGPQGRQLRTPIRYPQWIDRLQAFKWKDKRLTNFDMETAGIYALAEHMGHRALAVNALLANRATGVFSTQAEATIERMIKYVLEACTTLPD